LHPAELTVCCRLIRFSWHGASCPGEILRFSTVSLPEVRKKRGADVDFQAVWAHVSNQKLQVSPRGASDWWRESVRNSVSVHQYKIRGSAIQRQAIVSSDRKSVQSPLSSRPRYASMPVSNRMFDGGGCTLRWRIDGGRRWPSILDDSRETGPQVPRGRRRD